MKGHGFDGRLADHLRESLRFIQAGDVHAVTVNTHDIAIIRRADIGFARVDRFCVVCTDCKALVAFDANVRSAVVQIEKHTEGNDLDEKARAD